MKIYIHTLGCKMNFVDSEKISKSLYEMGFFIVKDPTKANISILNTCTVTDTADAKSFKKAKKLLKESGKLIITGCSVRTNSTRSLSEAQILPTAQAVIDFFHSIKKEEQEKIDFPKSRTRAFVEIQTGCDTYCSYCIIPFARGKSWSRPMDEIISEINKLGDTKEVVLTGINMASYGASNTNNPQENRFAELLEAILQKTKIPRVRLSSLGPEFLNDDFFEVFKNPRICDHLHISIQSGSKKVLKDMNRGHGVEEIIKVAEKARLARPNVALTSDFIVAFPTEAEKDFVDSMNLAKKIGLSKLHIFPFSPRKGTRAEKMPALSQEIGKERAKRFRDLGDNLRKDFIQKNIGKTHSVLFEDKESGWTTNYIRVFQKGAKENEIRKIVLSKENIYSNEVSK